MIRLVVDVKSDKPAQQRQSDISGGFSSSWFAVFYVLSQNLLKPTTGVVVSVRPSVRPLGTARLLLDGFFVKFGIQVSIETFSRMCKLH